MGMTTAVTAPASTSPTAIAAVTIIENAERYFCGEYSAISTTMLGRVAPRPMPVTTRQTRNTVGSGAAPLITVDRPKTKTEKISSRRRP
jgi:hypothetical protein